MVSYNFKKFILRDKVLLLFFLFLFINFFSYATATLFGTTLIPVRIGFLMILLWLLLRDKLRFQMLDKINNNYVFIFLFLYTLSFIVNFAVGDTLFFFSLFISVVVCSFFIEYISRHYPVSGDKILLDMIFFSLLFFPIILLLNPGYIRLNLYANNNIERLGLKSRYLGWACSVLFGILLYQFYQNKRKWWKYLFLVLLLFFIIISGSRSSLLAVAAVTFLYFFNQKNKVGYLLTLAFGIIIIGILFSSQINDYAEKVSFQKRQEAKELGVSDDSYRGDVIVDAAKMSWGNVISFFFGFGAGQFTDALSHYNVKYRYNELSSHNTYLEVFITSGLLCFIAFLFLFVIMPLKNFYLKKKELLYVFLPIIIIAATEDNFGLGQFLYAIFLLMALYSFKL